MNWNISKKAFVVVAGVALSACTPLTDASSPVQEGRVSEVDQSQAVTAETTVTAENPVVAANFKGGGLGWSDHGDMMYRFTAIERDGEVFICGAYSGRGSSIGRKFTREAMRLAKVTVDDQTILRNLRFFAEASSANWDNRLVGSATRCNATGEPAGSLDLNAVRVELREGRYRIHA